MALEVQNQQPLQQVPASGGATTVPSGGHAHAIATGCTQPTLHPAAIPITLDLFHTNLSPPDFHIQLLPDSSPLPFGWQKFLNLKTGETSTKKRSLEDTKMSRRYGNAPKLDLKLNLSPPRGNPHVATPSRSATVSPTSPPSSCVSSELNQEEIPRYSNSPEATSMVLVGCPRCLMYVMLAEEDPRCPKCKSTVLLDVLPENTTTAIKKTRKS